MENFDHHKLSIKTENLLKGKKRSTKNTGVNINYQQHYIFENQQIPLKMQKSEKIKRLHSKKSTVNLDKNLKMKAKEINEQINKFRRLSRKYTQNQFQNRYQ